jgi:hypothetical protein
MLKKPIFLYRMKLYVGIDLHANSNYVGVIVESILCECAAMI